jgi:hypothetical protein
VTAEKNLLLANRENERSVQSQGGDRRAACRGPTHDGRSHPAKMIRPEFAARVEKIDGFPGLRVRGGLAGTFAERARDAGQREIGRGGRAVRRDGHDVIEVKRGFLSRLGQTAIFAAVAGTRDDRPSQLGRDRHGLTHWSPGAGGAEAEERKKLREIYQALRFLAFGCGERAGCLLFVEQGLKAVLHAGRQAEISQIVGHFNFKVEGGHRGGRVVRRRQTHGRFG